MTASSFSPRVRRRPLLFLPAALGFGTMTRSSHRANARQTSPGPTLLVRGDIELSTDRRLAWRVVREVAELPPDAAFEGRSTGFAMASSNFTSMLVTDEATGSAYRLAFDEAAFVRDGTVQRAESLDERPVQYLRIKLAEATAPENASGFSLVFSGPAFAVPAGAITLALQRAGLMAGDTVELPPGIGETLVLVEAGEVELEIGEGAPRERLETVVGSGTYYVARSVGAAATLYAARDGARVLVATIQEASEATA